MFIKNSSSSSLKSKIHKAVSIALISAGFIPVSHAVETNVNINNPTGTTIDGEIAVTLNNGASFTIDNDGTIAGSKTGITSRGIDVTSSTTVTDFQNTGTISGTATTNQQDGVRFNASTLTTLTNDGTISGDGRANGTAINLEASTATSITNNGTISVEIDLNNGFGIELRTASTITNLTNTGTISSSAQTFGQAIIARASTITNLTNTGTISGTTSSAGSGSDAHGVELTSTSTIGTLTNSGTISGTATNGDRGYGVHGRKSTITTLTNSGTISGTSGDDDSAGINLQTQSEITTLTNTGTISGVTADNSGSGIELTSTSTIGTLTNDGTISASTTTSNNAYGVRLSSAGNITSLTNNDTIVGTSGVDFGTGISLINANSAITTLTNNGTISGSAVDDFGQGVVVDNASGITTLTNSGTISGTAADVAGVGILVDRANSVITTLTNHGTITGTSASGAAGVAVDRTAAITTLLNTGTITGTATGAEGYGVFLQSTSTLTTLTNTGTISGSDSSDTFGVKVDTISGLTTFNNLQSDLAYTGRLPQNYRTIIQGNNYGKLALSGTLSEHATGDTVYTPYAGDANTGVNIKAGTYANVMTGMADANLSNTVTGTLTGDGTDSVGTANWTLSNVSGNNWDLATTGSYAFVGHDNTQLALNQTSLNIGGIFNNMEAAANFAKTATFDCNIFSENGCISFGGRITDSDGTDTAATLVLGKKIDDNFRVSGYVDQTINHDNYNDINVDANIPLIGLTGVWNKNEDHQGLQIRVANSYQSNDAEITRAVVGTSELAKGKTTVASQSYTAEASYQITNLITDISHRPFVALKYMKTEMDGYTEKNATAPASYSDMDQDNISAIVGVKAEKKVSSKVTLKGSLGLETDLNSNDAKLQGAITGLAAFNSAAIGSDKNNTRPLASLGANINLEGGQRIEIEGLYQELRYKKDDATTVYLTYTLPF